jgi:hypothetical protein
VLSDEFKRTLWGREMKRIYYVTYQTKQVGGTQSFHNWKEAAAHIKYLLLLGHNPRISAVAFDKV